MDTLMNNWKHLADSIVLQAVLDYRQVLRGIPIGFGDNKKPIDETIEEIESFLHSDWFFFLSKLNGTMIINKLRGELEDESNICDTPCKKKEEG